MKQPSIPAPALARGLQLLDQLAVDGQASLEKLAARNGWPKSSVLRFLQTLEQAGAVLQDPASRHWRALKHLQPLEPPSLPPLEQVRKQLPGLAQGTGHCAELYLWQGNRLRLIDRAEPDSGEWRATSHVLEAARANGIRRFAVPVLHENRLLGVLAVAQRQTPGADAETDFVTRILQPTPSP